MRHIHRYYLLNSLLSLIVFVACSEDKQSDVWVSGGSRDLRVNDPFPQGTTPNKEAFPSEGSDVVRGCGSLSYRQKLVDESEAKLNDLGYFFRDSQDHDVDSWTRRYDDRWVTVKVGFLDSPRLAMTPRSEELVLHSLKEFKQVASEALADCSVEMSWYQRAVVQLKVDHTRNHLIKLSTLRDDSTLRESLALIEGLGAKIQKAGGLWNLQAVRGQDFDVEALDQALFDALRLIDQSLSDAYSYQGLTEDGRRFFSMRSLPEPHTRADVVKMQDLFRTLRETLQSDSPQIAFAKSNQSILLSSLEILEERLKTEHGIQMYQIDPGRWSINIEYLLSWRREDPFRTRAIAVQNMHLRTQRNLLLQIFETVSDDFLDDVEMRRSLLDKMSLIDLMLAQ